MKVQELLTNIYSKNFDIMEELEVKHYISIMDKKKFVMDVISVCTDDFDGFITVDRFKMDIYFNMAVLGLYTNLDIDYDFDEMVKQYDALCENGVLNSLLNLFEPDYNVMCNALNNVLDELLVQNSIDMQVVKIANKINNIIDIAKKNLDGVDLKTILPEVKGINELMDALK